MAKEIQKPQVIEFNAGATVNAVLPNQNISEEDKYKENGKWFFDNVIYCSTFFNRPLNNLITPEFQNKNVQWQPITRIIINMLYYLGEQPNLTYGFMAQNADQNNYIPSWRNGQDMLPIIENMRGNIKKILNSFHFSVKPLSENAKSKRSEYYNNVMLEWHLKNSGQQLSGVEFNPSNTQVEGMNEAEVKKYIDKEYKDYMCELMVNIAEGAWDIGALNDFDRAALYSIVAGWAGIEHYVDNGRHFRKVLLPYQMIVDTRENDALNRDARFAGVVTSMTPTEIFHRYPQFDSKQRNDIQLMARDSSLWGKYNSSITTFNWWNAANTGNQDATATAVRMYWVSPHFMNTREVQNTYGVSQLFSSKVEWDSKKSDLTFYGEDKYTISKVKEDNLGDYLPREDAYALTSQEGEEPIKKLDTSSVYVVNDVYKGTIVGNKYLVDFGLSTNLVEHPLMKYKPMLPIQVYIPNMIGGNPRSVVDRLRDIQDEISAARQIRREMLGRAKGKVVAIYGWKFNAVTGAREFLEDAAQMGVHVLTSSGEIPDGLDTGKPIDILDMTLDPNFNKIEEHIVALKEEMKEICSTSGAALGQINNYVGEGTLQNSVSQSTLGQSSIIDTFIDWVTQNLQYELNVKKTLYVENPDSFDAEIMVGDEGTEFFKKVLPDLKFEDFLLRVHVRDVIDEKQRQQLVEGLVQPYMQNIGNPEADVALLNAIKLIKARTFTETADVLEEAVESRIKVNKEQQAQARQQAVEDRDMQQQGAEILALKQQYADLVKKLSEIDRKGEWDAIVAAIKEGMKQQAVPPATQTASEVVSTMQ